MRGARLNAVVSFDVGGTSRAACSGEMLYAGNGVIKKNSQIVSLHEINRPGPRLLFGLNRDALALEMSNLGEPTYRVQQLADGLYRRRAENLGDISTLPAALKQRMAAEGWEVGLPRIVQVFTSKDGTERYLIEGQPPNSDTVEAVWMPEGDEGESGDGSEDEEVRSRHRATICVSSQVGCAVNCQFCLTARLGLMRNLSAGEIAGQVVAVLNRHAIEVGRDRLNLVFMGMGEPFLNYDNFIAAVNLLVREVGISPQRMTVSTSGIVPGIERFALEPANVRPKLAISLNAPNNEVRGEIMPINKKWPIEAVIDAVRQVRLRRRERITFEYVLLSGITDRPEHAREVARLVRRCGIPAKVNLIAWNSGPDVPYSTPDEGAVEIFRNLLAGEGIAAYLRRPRGRDIYAACGQLKRTVEAQP